MIAPRRAVADDAPGLEANRRRRATGSHDPYSKSCSDSESALPGVHNPLEDMMSKSTLTRRALVASTDPCRPRLPELARVAQAAAEPDPAFALIERFKEASAIYGRAAAAEEQAIDRFRDRFGRSRPEALSKEVRATALPK
jgi:hypothetical protein